MFCKKGTLFDGCGGCFEFGNFPLDKVLYYAVDNGCSEILVYGGQLNDTLDYLIDDVYPEVDQFLKDQTNSGLTKDRRKTSIVGYSHGGAGACYAGWTRPEVWH